MQRVLFMKEDKDPFWVSKVSPRPVFLDPTHHRRRMLLGITLVFLLFSAAWFGEFFLRVNDLPRIPDPESFGASAHNEQTSGARGGSNLIMMREGAVTDCGQFDLLPTEPGKRLSGYLPYGDRTALSGLRAKCNELDDLYFEAFVFGGPNGGAIQPLGPDAGYFPLAEFSETWMGRNKPSSFALISPAAWVRTEEISDVLAREGDGDFGDSADHLSVGNDVSGVCLDLSEHPGVDPAALKNALAILFERSPNEDPTSCLLASTEAPFWFDPDITSRLDRVVVTLPSIQLAAAATTGSLQELKGKIEEISRAIPADKLQLAFGSQGAVIRSGERNPQPISLAETMYNAAVFDGVIGYSADVAALSVRYTDSQQELNRVWLPDIATWLDRLAIADVPTSPVIWPLGYEDPSIWGRDALQSQPVGEQSDWVDLSSFNVFTGSGPFSALVAVAETGKRATTLTETGAGDYPTAFSALPVPNHVNFFGQEASGISLSLVIIGLPTNSQARELVEVLSALELEIVFFASMSDLLGAEDTVSLLIEAGHQVGITLQPRTSLSWLAQKRDHLGRNLVQHLLAHQLDLQARFVLAPGAPDRIPDTLARLDQMRDLQASGLFVVHPSVEAFADDFDAEAFAERVYEQALGRDINVISVDIRDAASREVLRELPPLIEGLKSDGFDFLALHELAGISASEALPPAEIQGAKRDDITYATLSISWLGIQGTIFLLALIVALRSPIYLFLALVRRKGPQIDGNYHPRVTLIVPAYNEEKVIKRTIQSAIESDYPDLEIIVVDDGSTDDTAKVVETHFSDVPNLTLVCQENGGKWSAIDHAIELADTPIICILDADSLIERTAISHIVQPFKDARVGAVAGTVEIGNSSNLLTAFQTLEYMYTQQVMRRAYEVFDGIIVVPGAIGAWRTSAVVEAGLVSGDTITEDADLTIAVHRSGYKVRYQEAAKSYTEAPIHIRGFLRQRLRWTFGMIQVSWKHKGTVSELRPVGLISMVDAIWYALVTSLIYPIMDIVLVVAVFKLGYFYLTTGSVAAVSLPILGSAAYLLLICVDFLNIFFSMLFAKRFSLKLLVVAPLLRFGYRQLLYISTIRAIFAALFGNLTSWNKLDRTGGTRLPT
jgi:cellulose synthase/poly-beta-1,6-N-acetylglucosamine synthase-like glycosyltransferase